MKLSIERRTAIRDWLKQEFPVFRGTPRPLAINIRQRILTRLKQRAKDHDISVTEMDALLHMHVNSFHYHKSVLTFKARFDGYGRPVGWVSDHQREHSQKCIDLLNKRKEELKAQGKWVEKKKPRRKTTFRDRPTITVKKKRSLADHRSKKS